MDWGATTELMSYLSGINEFIVLPTRYGTRYVLLIVFFVFEETIVGNRRVNPLSNDEVMLH